MTSFWHNIRDSVIIFAIIVNAVVMTACVPIESEASVRRRPNSVQPSAELRNVKLRSWKVICVYNPPPNEKALLQFNYFVLLRGKPLVLLQGREHFFPEIRFWYGDCRGGRLIFGAESLNRIVRWLPLAFELYVVGFVPHRFTFITVNDSYGWSCAAILPNCFNRKILLFLRFPTLNSWFHCKPFPCYKSPLDGDQRLSADLHGLSVDFQRLLINLIGVRQGPPLEERNYSVGENYNECGDFNRFFPPKLAILSAIIGIIAVFWGWGNARSGLCLPYSDIFWMAGCILWIYGLWGIMLWAARCHWV